MLKIWHKTWGLRNILEFDLGNCNFIFNNLHTLQFWMQEVIQAWKLAVGGQVLAHCCLQFISLLWSSTIWGWSKPWRHFFNSSAILGWSELWRHFFNASTSAEKKCFAILLYFQILNSIVVKWGLKIYGIRLRQL